LIERANKRDLVGCVAGRAANSISTSVVIGPHELVQAKVEQRAPEVAIAPESGEAPKVVNIMDALKKSMQARGQTKVRNAVRKRMGGSAPKREVTG
jgi:non-homologous end joining protein Ku